MKRNGSKIWLSLAIVFAAVMYSIFLFGFKRTLSPSQMTGYLFTMAAFAVLLLGTLLPSGIPDSMPMMKGPITAARWIYFLLQFAFGGVLAQIRPDLSVGLVGFVGILLLVLFILFFLLYRSRISGALKQEKVTGKYVSRMRSMTAQAQTVLEMLPETGFSDPEASRLAQEVTEGLRYSDPVSDPSLKELEGRIEENLKLWQQAAEDKDEEQFLRKARKLKELITQRKNQCLALKK